MEDWSGVHGIIEIRIYEIQSIHMPPIPKIPVNFRTIGRIRRGLLFLVSKDIQEGVIDQDRLSLNGQILKILRERYGIKDESEAYSHDDATPVDMSVRLPLDVHEALVNEAADHKKHGRKEYGSINRIINDALEKKLAELE